MFTHCRVKWLDDGSEEDVIIKATEEVVQGEDDQIFFYGLSREKLIEAYEKQIVMENEWKVVAVYQTCPCL